jgi:hypothetical protein
MVKQMRIFSACGNLGYGFPEENLNRALAMDLTFLGSDAGSTDCGPYYLGEGVPFVSRAAFKRDARLLLKAALTKKIPLVLGSCIGNGGNDSVNIAVEVFKELAKDEELRFTMAVIYVEQEKAFLKEQLRKDKITSMGLLPELTEKDINDSVHTVALMGHEPYIKALEMGAQVVIAGRTTDTSIYAAIPIAQGFDPGLAWHAGKLLECGASSTQEFAPGDCIVVTLEEDCFYVEPMNPNLHHTPTSVAAHSLYENGSPFHLYEPGGMIDLTDCKYEAVNNRKVKVSGSKWIPAPVHKVKLKSARFVGYRTVSIMGTKDPGLISQIDDYEQRVRRYLKEKIHDAFGDTVKDSDYIFNFRVYGRNAVMGPAETSPVTSHELGIVLESIAPTPELSAAIGAFGRTFTLHMDFPGRKCSGGNMGIAFSPADIPAGRVYDFNMEHLLEVEDPLSLVDIQIMQMGSEG